MIRHVQSVGNEIGIIDSISPKFDLGLSEKGKKQAKDLVPRLNKYKFEAVIVSPLKRTIETLNPYLETLSNPKVIVNELTTERNAGEFIGKKLSALKEYCDKSELPRAKARGVLG